MSHSDGVLVNPLAALIAWTVAPYRRTMENKVSPARTKYTVDCPGGGVACGTPVVNACKPAAASLPSGLTTSARLIEQMELLGHDFYVFFNAEAGAINVLYRRKDGN